MNIIRCRNGHYYDDSKFSTCPHCAGNTPAGRESRPVNEREAKTVPGDSLREQVTVAKGQNPGHEVIREAVTEMHRKSEDGKTVRFYDTKIGIDPVVGWLVCISGPEKGRDYRLHEGRNFIGRLAKMDVCIVDDDQIQRNNHATLIFEPRKCEFILTLGEGADVTLNGAPLAGPERIKDHDVIRLGQTTLEFVAYCKGGSRWEEK
jgi:hypothetical protein